MVKKSFFITIVLLMPCIATPAFASGYIAAQRQLGRCNYDYIYAF